MKTKAYFITAISMLLGLGYFALGNVPEDTLDQAPDNVNTIIKQNCSVSGCHSGKYPAANMSLEQDKFPASVVDVASLEVPELKIVEPASPEKSYLIRKVKGGPGIVGKRMPANRDPLTEEQIGQLEEWIRSLTAGPAGLSGAQIEPGPLRGPHLDPSGDTPDGAGQDAATRARSFSKPAFWGTRLVNLPTTTTPGKGEFLFRISHRFQPPVSDGWDAFYGLDGPAFILFSFGYGITDNLTATIGRSKLYQEWELSADWSLLEQGKNSSLPFSATLHVGGSVVSLDKPIGAEWSGRFRLSALVSLAHQLSDRLSFLLVPAFSSNTNFWEPSSEGTFSLAIGGRFIVMNDLSLIAEWIPRLAGYKDDYSGWGFGIEKKIGGHVFQVFITDSLGLTASQFLPGGDLRLGDGDFRLGFNIFRSF
ncbi:MAG: DUF5777 family beta-barrel protein [Candidatus Aminicenantales bacterium]